MTQLRWAALAAGVALAGLLVVLARAALVGLEGLGSLLIVEFVALAIGGFVAARVAGRFGVAHGLGVAIAYIVIATAVQGWQELNMASAEGPDAVGSVDLLSLIVADLVHLSAGTLGGWMAGTGGLPSRQG